MQGNAVLNLAIAVGVLASAIVGTVIAIGYGSESEDESTESSAPSKHGFHLPSKP